MSDENSSSDGRPSVGRIRKVVVKRSSNSNSSSSSNDWNGVNGEETKRTPPSERQPTKPNLPNLMVPSRPENVPESDNDQEEEITKGTRGSVRKVTVTKSSSSADNDESDESTQSETSAAHHQARAKHDSAHGQPRGIDEEDNDSEATSSSEGSDEEDDTAQMYRQNHHMDGDDDDDVARFKNWELRRGSYVSETEDKPDDDGDAGQVPIGMIRGHSFLRKELSSDEFSHYEDREELMTVDYTPAINARPVDLHKPLRTLRLGRDIVIAVCITLYNEEVEELKMSLRGVAENLSYLAVVGIDWTQVQVVIVADGRNKLSESVQEYLTKDLLLYYEDLLLESHKGNSVTMHLYEKTIELARHSSQRQYFFPMQVLFALKEKNGGKLNSHLWFFSAFCRQLQPKYVFLIDAGTAPKRDAMMHLYQCMEENPQIGGAAGEIQVRTPRFYHMLEAAQDFEYRASHILDKPMESVFGYLSVLPGAFSSFRWEAVRGEPLSQYFKLEETGPKDLGPFVSNMYLAEDRILSYEIVSKRRRNYTLHFDKRAVAVTDVPSNLLELTKQRRRWLNGAFFALLYYIRNFWRLMSRSSHSIPRRIALIIQFVYYVVTLAFNWFGVSMLYLSFSFIVSLALENVESHGVTMALFLAFHIVYLTLTFLQVLFGLGSKAQDVQRVYFVSSIVYGLLIVIAIGLSLWQLSGETSFALLLISAAGFGSFFVAACLHGRLYSMATNFLQYVFMLPTFLNMFTIYSLCNMHDVSWGTKEGNLRAQLAQARDQVAEKAEDVKAGSKHADPTSRHLDILRKAAKYVAQDPTQQTGDFGAALQKETPEQVMLQVAEQAERERHRERVNRNKAKLAEENEELKRRFASFRTRLLSFWLFANGLFASIVLGFGLLSLFAWFMAGAVVVQMAYRLFGAVWYLIEGCLKSVWKSCFAWWFCCRCCWERHKMERFQLRDKKRRMRQQRQVEQYVAGIHDGGRKNDETGSLASAIDSEDEEEEEKWGIQDWSNYAGYGVVHEKAQVDPATGKKRRASHLIGWDQEMDENARQQKLGRRQSIFESDQPVEIDHGPKRRSARVSLYLGNEKQPGGVSQPPSSDTGALAEPNQVNGEISHPENSKDRIQGLDSGAVNKGQQNDRSGSLPLNEAQGDGKRQSSTSASDDRLSPSSEFDGSDDLAAYVHDGQEIAESMARKLKKTYGDADGFDNALSYVAPDGTSDVGIRDAKPVWDINSRYHNIAKFRGNVEEQPSNIELQQTDQKNSLSEDQLSGSPEDVDNGVMDEEQRDNFNAVSYSEESGENVEENEGHQSSSPGAGDDLSSGGTKDSDDSDTDDSEIGEQDHETSFRFPKQRGHSFLRKRFDSSEISEDESLDEAYTLDYTPAVNNRPVDLLTPLRLVRLGRQIELFVCVTYQGEGLQALKQTLSSVAENLYELRRSKVDWNRVALCLIIDGRQSVSNDVQEYLVNDARIWDPGMLLSSHKGSNVTCHIFERTVSLSRHSSQGQCFLPLQMLLATKEKPGGKLHSHLWFFSAFARHVQPKYCILMEAGVRPRRNALAKFYKEMEMDPSTAICFGQIYPLSPRYYNIAESSQMFDYGVTYSLQKPAESFAGYATPYTTGFSSYRWKAIRGEPLNQYFRIEEEGMASLGPFLSNLYLTVDRIISFETVSKRKRKWKSSYIPSAKADKPVPSTLVSLIAARRRQVSGTLFGYMYYLKHSMRIWKRSGHSILRKMILSAHTLMNVIYILFYWFAPALIYLVVFYVFTTSVAGLGFGTTIITFGFHLIYLSTIVLQVIFSLSSRSEEVERIFFISAIIYGTFMYVAITLFFISAAAGAFDALFLWGLAISGICVLVAAMIHGSLFSILFSFLQFAFMFPSYVNLFMVYSFAHLDDVSHKMKQGNLRALMAQARQRMKRPAGDVKLNQANKRASEILVEMDELFKGQRNQRLSSQGQLESLPDNTDESVAVARPENLRMSLAQDPREMLQQAYQAAQEELIQRELEERQKKIDEENEQVSTEFSSFRTRLLGVWLFTNWMLGAGFAASGNLQFGAWGVVGITVLVFVLRLLGTLFFYAQWRSRIIWVKYFSWWCSCKRKRDKTEGGKVHADVVPGMEVDGIQDNLSADSVEEYDEAQWGHFDWSEYVGYGISENAPSKEYIGWDEEMNEEARMRQVGRRHSIFNQPAQGLVVADKFQRNVTPREGEEKVDVQVGTDDHVVDVEDHGNGDLPPPGYDASDSEGDSEDDFDEGLSVGGLLREGEQVAKRISANLRKEEGRV